MSISSFCFSSEAALCYIPAKENERSREVATKTVKVSDLTGAEIGGEEHLARLVVEEHPSLPDSVTLEVLPEEVEDKLPEAQNYVRVSYFPPTDSGGEVRPFVMSVEEFNGLSTDYDMETILTETLRAQQEAEGRPRGRRGRRAGGERRRRVDYSSPEHAGEPHRGRITDEEKAYVREHLDAVNARLRNQGKREIDPTNPDMAERYGITETYSA
jgi:hypothetical protein